MIEGINLNLNTNMRTILNKMFEFSILENFHSINVDTVYYLLLSESEEINLLFNNLNVNTEDLKNNIYKKLKIDLYKDEKVETLSMQSDINNVLKILLTLSIYTFFIFFLKKILNFFLL